MPLDKGFFIKYGCLAFLTVQNSAYILTTRYSRTQPGPRYFTSTAVLLSELLKCLSSLLIYGLLGMKKKRRMYAQIGSIEAKNIEDETGDTTFPPLFPASRKEALLYCPILVPAILYMIQNNLQLIAISNLEATTFQVAYQAKLLTAAMFAVMFLKKRLTGVQVASIALLAIGVALASIQPKGADSETKSTHFIGLVAVGIAVLLSGFAGIYTELILKATQKQRASDELGAQMIFWHRNYQLAFASVIFALPSLWVIDGQELVEKGFLFAYSPVVWSMICQQAIGGIAVSFVITYADNILKGFATSISLILSTIGSVIIWNTHISNTFLVGMVVVLIATPMYALAERKNVPVVVPDVEHDLELEGYDEKRESSFDEEHR